MPDEFADIAAERLAHVPKQLVPLRADQLADVAGVRLHDRRYVLADELAGVAELAAQVRDAGTGVIDELRETVADVLAMLVQRTEHLIDVARPVGQRVADLVLRRAM